MLCEECEEPMIFWYNRNGKKVCINCKDKTKEKKKE